MTKGACYVCMSSSELHALQRAFRLTAGVDVQKDRIEVEAVAWGLSKESWSVDYRVIEGDTARALVLMKATPRPHA